MAILRRCFSHSVSLLSPVFSEILFPISWIIFLVEGPKTPEVSMAIGSKLYLWTNTGYLFLLSFSALAAACPLSIAAWLMILSPKVLTQVASQQRDLPWLKGKIVMPSGLFLSPRSIPTGSNTDGVPDDLSERWIISLIAACLGCLPSLNWHERRWKPYSSAFLPHLQRWFSQILEPVLCAYITNLDIFLLCKMLLE